MAPATGNNGAEIRTASSPVAAGGEASHSAEAFEAFEAVKLDRRFTPDAEFRSAHESEIFRRLDFDGVCNWTNWRHS